jgi:hypothetical protein
MAADAKTKVNSMVLQYMKTVLNIKNRWLFALVIYGTMRSSFTAAMQGLYRIGDVVSQPYSTLQIWGRSIFEI